MLWPMSMSLCLCLVLKQEDIWWNASQISVLTSLKWTITTANNPLLVPPIVIFLFLNSKQVGKCCGNLMTFNSLLCGRGHFSPGSNSKYSWMSVRLECMLETASLILFLLLLYVKLNHYHTIVVTMMIGHRTQDCVALGHTNLVWVCLLF